MNEVTETTEVPAEPLDYSAIRWAVGAFLALPVVVGLWLAITLIVFSFAADAWFGLLNKLGN